jgi:hypothetical protein
MKDSALGLYILDDQNNPIKANDVLEWGKFFEQTGRRQVARTNIGNVLISTVFLGIDHGWMENEPVLFETMIFNLPEEEDEYQTRCSTWQQALEMHNEAVRYVEAKLAL